MNARARWRKRWTQDGATKRLSWNRMPVGGSSCVLHLFYPRSPSVAHLITSSRPLPFLFPVVANAREKRREARKTSDKSQLSHLPSDLEIDGPWKLGLRLFSSSLVNRFHGRDLRNLMDTSWILSLPFPSYRQGKGGKVRIQDRAISSFISYLIGYTGHISGTNRWPSVPMRWDWRHQRLKTKLSDCVVPKY